MLVTLIILAFLLWIFWHVRRVDSEIDIQGESEHSNANAPILKLREVSVEQEYIEKELVNHLQVAQHLQLAGLLVLESHEFEHLGSDNR